MKSQDKKRKTGIARLIQIAGGRKWTLTASVFLAVVTTLLQFVPFLSVYKILQLLVNTTEEINRTEVYYWAYITLGSFILAGISMFASIIFSHIAAFDILYKIRVSIAKKLIRLPLGFFSRRATGEIKKVMNEDVERIELFVAHHIADIVSAIIVPFILVIYMFCVDWRLAVVTTIMLLISFAVMANMMLSEKTKKAYEDYAYYLGRMNASTVEYIKGIQVVKTFTKSTEAYTQLNNDIRGYEKFSCAMSGSYSKTYTSFQTLLYSMILIIAPAAIYILVHSNSYVDYLPKAMMFMIFGIGLIFPVLKLMWIGGFINQNKQGVALLDNILYSEEIEDSQEPQILPSYDIEFKNVSFAYEDKEVLNNVSFKANTGTITALVGSSGTGKSTIASLIARFWDVTKGEILIGGIPIKSIPVEDLMNTISFVFQDNLLFFDTIEENIRMGNQNATFEQVEQAAKMAQAHEFITELSDAYKTKVGEGGTYLSGGEQQRIALARVALKNSPILLLDEATAYADPENESQILEAFSHIIKGKTVIIIAHRLHTIVNANQILYIEKGQIAERGTQSELLSLKGGYAKMWEAYISSRNWRLKRA